MYDRPKLTPRQTALRQYNRPEPPNRTLILREYSQAYEANPNLTPTEFMLLANPGENEVVYKGRLYKTTYKNYDSAGRQWRKISPRKPGVVPTSGERMAIRSLGRRERYQVGGTRKEPVYAYRNAPRLGGGMGNMWRITVIFESVDSNGETVRWERSTTIQGTGRPGLKTTYEGVRLAQSDEVQDLIDAKVEEWKEGSPPKNVSVTEEPEVVGTIIQPVVATRRGTQVTEVGDYEDEEDFE